MSLGAFQCKLENVISFSLCPPVLMRMSGEEGGQPGGELAAVWTEGENGVWGGCWRGVSWCWGS